MSRLIRAISTGSGEKVDEILSQKPELVNVRNLQGKTALIAAIESNQTDIARILLNTPNIDVNIGSDNNYCALTASISLNNESIACDIIKHNNYTSCNPNQTCHDGQHMIFHAIEKNMINLIDHSLQHYINHSQIHSNTSDASNNNDNNNTFELNLLTTNSNNQNIIHYCVINNKQTILNNIIYKLIQNNQNNVLKDLIDILDNNGHSPLWLAVSNDNFNITQILLTNGANINQICSDGRTVSHLILSKSCNNTIDGRISRSNRKFIQLLTDFGADLEIKDNEGISAQELMNSIKDNINAMNDNDESDSESKTENKREDSMNSGNSLSVNSGSSINTGDDSKESRVSTSDMNEIDDDNVEDSGSSGHIILSDSESRKYMSNISNVSNISNSMISSDSMSPHSRSSSNRNRNELIEEKERLERNENSLKYDKKHKRKIRRKMDDKVLDWLQMNGLIIFATPLLNCYYKYCMDAMNSNNNNDSIDTKRSIKLTLDELFSLEENELIEIFKYLNTTDDLNEFNEIDDEMIGFFIDIWRNDKISLMQNRSLFGDDFSHKQRKIKKKKKRRKCDRHVRDFLKAKSLNITNLECLFAKERINMSRLAGMTHSWINHHVTENTFGINEYENIRERLYCAILDLRKEIAYEMEMKLQEEYLEYEREQRRLDEMDNNNNNDDGENGLSFLNIIVKNNRRNKNSLLYKIASKLDSFVSDPLYLISVGFGILILFTFVLFIVVGHAPTTQAKP